MSENLETPLIGKRASTRPYVPIANAGLVRPVGSHAEHMVIQPYLYASVPNENDRIFDIVSDTVLSYEGDNAEFYGDSRFLLNALLQAIHRPQTSLDLLNYGSGLRSESYQSPREHSGGTNFHRAVNAIDAWSLDVSGDVFVQRDTYGSGRPAAYQIRDDIVVRDLRTIHQSL